MLYICCLWLVYALFGATIHWWLWWLSVICESFIISTFAFPPPQPPPSTPHSFWPPVFLAVSPARLTIPDIEWVFIKYVVNEDWMNISKRAEKKRTNLSLPSTVLFPQLQWHSIALVLLSPFCLLNVFSSFPLNVVPLHVRQFPFFLSPPWIT